MAIDTKEKRVSVLGVARPWMRDKLPTAIDSEWRIDSGNAYSGNEFTFTGIVDFLCLKIAVYPSILADLAIMPSVLARLESTPSVTSDLKCKPSIVAKLETKPSVIADLSTGCDC